MLGIVACGAVFINAHVFVAKSTRDHTNAFCCEGDSVEAIARDLQQSSLRATAIHICLALYYLGHVLLSMGVGLCQSVLRD